MEAERVRSYSLCFRFLNFLSGRRLQKYLTKALIFLIRARDRLRGREVIEGLELSDSYIISNITYAINMINKIFEI